MVELIGSKFVITSYLRVSINQLRLSRLLEINKTTEWPMKLQNYKNNKYVHMRSSGFGRYVSYPTCRDNWGPALTAVRA